MLRTAVAIAAIAGASAFQTPALNGVIGAKMVDSSAVSRKALVQGAGAIAIGFLGNEAANAAKFDPNTGFPVQDGKKDLLCNGSASAGCQPMTQSASITDKQKAILAGEITVKANKLSVLDAELAAMKKSAKKNKPAKLDKDLVLRYSALYLSPLSDAMTSYCARDAGGAKFAGGAGLPKIGDKTEEVAQSSGLYTYVSQVKSAMTAMTAAAKAGDFEGVTAANDGAKKAADSFLGAANAPIVFN
uniref:Uncharacterized protein n=1 Tax=Hemiselmis andersenii TaxID=464988 RepID=A0A6U5CLT6_HEMAN|mmetsp:Transcript_21120/g.48857  ORF Transcript_21120/g.48857 Transcript_21120/m.48857 type:complete len:245 (+) Transcript_21120:27-761(+)